MNLTKEEKKCWQKHFRIEKLQDIPTEMMEFSSIDGDADDELMYYLAKRVSIPEMYLECNHGNAIPYFNLTFILSSWFSVLFRYLFYHRFRWECYTIYFLKDLEIIKRRKKTIYNPTAQEVNR